MLITKEVVFHLCHQHNIVRQDVFHQWAFVFVLNAQDKMMTSSYSPVLTTKAVKDETEQQILRDAHVRRQHTDGQANTPTCRFQNKTPVIDVNGFKRPIRINY